MIQYLEIKHNIHIIYAVETGPRACSMDFIDSPFEIQFIYIRNRQNGYSYSLAATRVSGHSDDFNYYWNGVDIADCTTGIQSMNTDHLSMLYSPIVYKNEGSFDFVEKMRKLVQTQPRMSLLFSRMRSNLNASFTTVTNQRNDVYLRTYFKAIKDAASIEWITLQFLHKQAGQPSKLFETNFTTIMHDLQGHLDTELHSALVYFVNTGRKQKCHDSVPRIDMVDNWILNVFKQSLDVFRKAEEGEWLTSIFNRNQFKDILKSNLKIKFKY